MTPESLPPLPLEPAALARIRTAVRAAARRGRARLAEGAIHAGFALGAVGWALAAVLS